jgi:hypothetical protein
MRSRGSRPADPVDDLAPLRTAGMENPAHKEPGGISINYNARTSSLLPGRPRTTSRSGGGTGQPGQGAGGSSGPLPTAGPTSAALLRQRNRPADHRPGSYGMG